MANHGPWIVLSTSAHPDFVAEVRNAHKSSANRHGAGFNPAKELGLKLLPPRAQQPGHFTCLNRTHCNKFGGGNLEQLIDEMPKADLLERRTTLVGDGSTIEKDIDCENLNSPPALLFIITATAGYRVECKLEISVSRAAA